MAGKGDAACPLQTAVIRYELVAGNATRSPFRRRRQPLQAVPVPPGHAAVRRRGLQMDQTELAVLLGA
eukprot:6371842-Prymnesium_polylepis.1